MLVSGSEAPVSDTTDTDDTANSITTAIKRIRSFTFDTSWPHYTRKTERPGVLMSKAKNWRCWEQWCVAKKMLENFQKVVLGMHGKLDRHMKGFYYSCVL